MWLFTGGYYGYSYSGGADREGSPPTFGCCFFPQLNLPSPIIHAVTMETLTSQGIRECVFQDAHGAMYTEYVRFPMAMLRLITDERLITRVEIDILISFFF